MLGSYSFYIWFIITAVDRLLVCYLEGSEDVLKVVRGAKDGVGDLYAVQVWRSQWSS